MENTELKKIITRALIPLLVIVLIVIFSNGEKDPEEVVDPNYGGSSNNQTEETDILKIDEQYLLQNKRISDLYIKPDFAREILENNNRNISEFGEIDYEFGGFKFLINTGIGLKQSQQKILAIRFKSEYNEEILDGVRVDTNSSDIKLLYGIPNIEESGFLVYLSNGFDLIINTRTNEITIYINQNIDSEYLINEMLKLHDEYEEDQNLKKYISNITKTYPSYFEYTYNEHGLVLKYFDLGLEFVYVNDNYLSEFDRLFNLEKYLENSNTKKEEQNQNIFNFQIEGNNLNNQNNNTNNLNNDTNKINRKNGVYLYENFFRNIEGTNVDREKIEKYEEENKIFLRDTTLSILYEVETTLIKDLYIEVSYEITSNLSSKHHHYSDYYIVYEEKLYQNEEYEYKNFYILIENKELASGYIDYSMYKLNPTANADDFLIIENEIIYGIDYDGIYIHNVLTGEITRLFDVDGEISLESYDAGILKFNGIEAVI